MSNDVSTPPRDPDQAVSAPSVRGSQRARELLELARERPPWLGPVLIGLAVIAVVAISGLVRSAQGPPVDELLPRVASPQVTLTEPEVVVHLSGRVRTPGVYRLRPGDRILDLLDAAGGATPDADVDRLNLAAVVFDGDRIHVPSLGDLGADLPAVADPSTDASRSGPIDLNRASAGELETLHGIGPALAAAIVDDRDRNGPYASVADLERVSGSTNSMTILEVTQAG